MKLIHQPPNSTQCGQACIAMLANTTPARVAKATGNDGPTTWEELYSVLNQFGIVCAPKLRPCFQLEDLPPVAVIALPGAGGLGHWVVKYGDWVYDPAILVPQQAVDLPFAVRPVHRVLKYAEVKNVKVKKESEDG